MRQKASADPDRSAAATEKVVVDFMVDMCGWRYQGLSRGSAILGLFFQGRFLCARLRRLLLSLFKCDERISIGGPVKDSLGRRVVVTVNE